MTKKHHSLALEKGESWLSRIWLLGRQQYFTIILAAFFINIMAIATPVYVLQVYDRVVFQGGLSTLHALVIGMFIVVVFDFILKIMKSKLFARIGLQIDLMLGRMIYHQMNATALRVLEKETNGYWQQLFRDVDVIRNLLAGPQAALLIDLPFGLIFLGIIAYMSLPLFAIVCVMMGCFVLLAIVSSLMMGRKTRKADKAYFDRYTALSELVQARTTLKSLALRDALSWRFDSHLGSSVEAASKRGGSTDIFQTLSTSLTMLTTIITTAFGALLILDQQLTIGILIASNMLSSRMIATLTQLVGQWRNIFVARKAMKRMNVFFALPKEDYDTVLQLEPPTQGYMLNKLRFNFAQNPHEPPVLDIMELRLPPKGLVVMMGSNGSGKTTLLKLLSGLYTPVSGKVTLDGADIQQYSRRQLSEWISYQPQEISLFSGNILENIAMGALDPEEVNDQAIINAAKKSGVHESIVAHPEGYMRQLGEAGSGLSGGQRQRLCLARSLIAERPILLLDEPTSHLDQQGNQAIAALLRAHSQDHLVITVSHNAALIDCATHLIVMHKGQVAVAGTALQVKEYLQTGKVSDGKA